MIPNLNELPPLPEVEHPLRKLVRPILAGLMLLAAAGGLFWLFSTFARQTAQEELNITGGLRGVAGDLWSTGTAKEIRIADPDLTTELARLRNLLGYVPRMVVSDAQNRAGQPMATHQLFYFAGEREVLSIRVFLDVEEGKVDVLSYRTHPEFAGDVLPVR